MDTQDNRPIERSPIEDSPFSESAATGRFFPGGRRREVLDGITSDLAGGVPIITLTGDEGSGKTVVCRMLVDRMSSVSATVYFPQTANSFEDVLKAIVQELGLTIDPAPRKRAELLQGIVSHLHDHNLRVLMIFDEAERIYLATLERVRKMLDLANVDGIYVQMVMAGRSGLHHNFRNLALVNFQPAEERHFSLEPLSEDETSAYLVFAVGDAAPAKSSLFGREAAASIFASSRGNFRAIARLADDLLRADEDRAQPGPVEEHEPRKIEREKRRRRLKRPTVVLPKLTFNRRYLAWGGAAACLVLALLLLRPEEKTVPPPAEAVRDNETSIAVSPPGETAPVEPDTAAMDEGDVARPHRKEPPPAPGGDDKVRPQPPAPSPAPDEPVVVATPQPSRPPAGEAEPEKEETPRVVVQQAVPSSATAETEKSAASGPIEPVVVSIPQPPPAPVAASRSEAEEKPPAESNADVAGPGEAQEQAPPAPPVEDIRRSETAVETAVTVSPPVEPAPRSQRQPEATEVVEPALPAAATEDVSIVPRSIKARPIIKHREQPAPEVQETIASQRPKILRQEETEPVEEPAAPVTIRAVEQKKESEVEGRSAGSDEDAAPAATKPKKIQSVDGIYASRVAAGAAWFSGIKDDRYTVRLMVITSGDAEKKLKSMLGEKKYREQADKFYILRRESNPGVQYVYYGEYPSMTAARNARNTIPEFLRGYRPYAMSVKGAVERAQQEE